jgi:hypothetical protein
LDLENPNERPDLLVSLVCSSFLIDVRGLHPLAQTYVCRDGDACMQDAFVSKQNKYDAIFQKHGLLTILFVFSTLGDTHHESHSLFSVMSRYFHENNPSPAGSLAPSVDSTVHFYNTALSVAIMHDNARILLDVHGRSSVNPRRT